MVKNWTMVIIVIVGITVGIVFGFMGSNFYELKIIDKNNIIIPTPTAISNSPAPGNIVETTKPIISIPISDRNKFKFGGIPSSVQQLLPGTHIDEKLTLNNRNRTIAVDDFGNRYYYVGYWGWFNQTEYNALNQFVKDNDLSPYSCDNPDNYCN